jgi:hypothetical protein
MKTLYLDMCCFNRPYDDQVQTRIKLETAASAIAGNADLFVTTDGRLLGKLRKHTPLKALLPAEALADLENWYENGS